MNYAIILALCFLGSIIVFYSIIPGGFAAFIFESLMDMIALIRYGIARKSIMREWSSTESPDGLQWSLNRIDPYLWAVAPGRRPIAVVDLRVVSQRLANNVEAMHKEWAMASSFQPHSKD